MVVVEVLEVVAAVVAAIAAAAVATQARATAAAAASTSAINAESRSSYHLCSRGQCVASSILVPFAISQIGHACSHALCLKG